MRNTIILDFMGVIADTDYKKLISGFSIPETFKALRVLVALKTNRTLKCAFGDYQKGLINAQQLEEAFKECYPKIAYMVPILLNKFKSCVKVNTDVLETIQCVREQGNRVLLMSNTIPETAELIEENEVYKYFDGKMLSTELGMKKPSSDIFNYAIKTYKLEPEYTVMIDDSDKNLEAAAKLNIYPIKSDCSRETNFLLNELLDVYEVMPVR